MNPLVTTGSDSRRTTTALSVNVNKIALLRNQRALAIPGVVDLSRIALEAGANGIRLWNGLPSMLNSTCGHCASSACSSATSCARMWRSSGRGCTVTPCAPASSTSVAARVTLGTPRWRVLRSSATLFRFTDSAVRWARGDCSGATSGFMACPVRALRRRRSYRRCSMSWRASRITSRVRRAGEPR